jgi:hypothetical protein
LISSCRQTKDATMAEIGGFSVFPESFVSRRRGPSHYRYTIARIYQACNRDKGYKSLWYGSYLEHILILPHMRNEDAMAKTAGIPGLPESRVICLLGPSQPMEHLHVSYRNAGALKMYSTFNWIYFGAGLILPCMRTRTHWLKWPEIQDSLRAKFLTILGLPTPQ